MAATSGNRSRPAIGCTLLSIVSLILLPLSHAADGGVGRAGGTPTATTTEIVQLPLAFRHQEHYSHRIEQAVSDFKRAQLQQQARAHYGEPATAAPSNAHKQSQLQPQPPEHLRHSHNRQHAAAAWKRYIFPPLRHQRHQQQLQLQQQQQQQQQQRLKQRQQPHTRYEATTETATQGGLSVGFGTPTVAADATNERDKKLPTISFNASSSALSSHRYFDRDGLFRAADSWTTRGPKLLHRSGGGGGSSKTRSYHDVLHRDFFADEALSHGTGDRHQSGQRISLSLLANEEEADAEDGEYDDDDDENENDNDNGRVAKERYESNDAGTERAPFGGPNANVDTANADDRVSNSNDNNNNSDDSDDDDASEDDDDDADADDADADYLYDDSEERSVGANAYPSASSGRTAVKRFTNPFRELRAPTKRDHSAFAAQRTPVGVDLAEAGGGDRAADDDALENNDAADADDDHDSDDSDSDNEFSSEKWRRIQQEHHRKQQEHQRQMQALRARHSGGVGGGGYQIAQSAVIVEAKQPRSNDDDAADSLNTPYYIPGTLTRQKQDELGTLAAVQESRRTHSVKHRHEKALASEHVKQILSGASCRVPQRRIERIQRDPAKIYMPHCTVLHRCSDDTGCCRSERQTCAPKRTKSVDLYFYVKSINEKRGSVERLTFINHTECHCVDKLKQRPDEYGSAALYGVGGEFGAGVGAQALRRATILNCNCPKLYEKILQEDGFCRCDCSSGNTGCDWLKRGMEHFSMIDRKCISEGRCRPPTCEHGSYIKKYGRCPRRDEQLSPLMLATNALPPMRH